MNWPKTIKIGGCWWRIVIHDQLIRDESANKLVAGLCGTEDRRIDIALRGDAIDTLFHELAHAFIDYVGIDQTEESPDQERNIDALGEAIRMFLCDNADFVRELLDEITNQDDPIDGRAT